MRTPKIEKYTILVSLVILLTGCKNALYFYETEKISLTVEARPDSTQPVQGSLGVKQRVVLITPPKDPKKASETPAAPNITPSKEDENGDAVSAISSFSFKIMPIDWEFNPVLIQTAFITGEAAAQLDTAQAANAAQAITVGDVQPPGADISIMRNVVDRLDQSNKEDNKHLSLLGGLGKAVIPTNYPVPKFALDATTNTLTIEKPKGSPVNYFDIDSALSYQGELDGSAQKLKGVLNAPDQYKFEGIPVTNEMVNGGLRNEYEKTEQELKRIGQELTGNSIYTDALQYYIDKYIKKTAGD